MNSVCEIDLSNLKHNCRQIKSILSPGTALMGVVKADAYGHGAVMVSKTLQEEGIDRLAVALVEEAAELRENGITLPILVFGSIPADEYSEVIRYSAEATVFDYSGAKRLSDYAKRHNTLADVHIKIDTGMGRVGIPYNAGCIETIRKIKRLENLRVKGIYSHFSAAGIDEGYTEKQFKDFTGITWNAYPKGGNSVIRHICNSPAAILHPHMHLDMVRCGIALYGVYPAVKTRDDSTVSLKNVMRVKTKVIFAKRTDEPSFISYGNTYRTRPGEIICTLPAGYADGIPRSLSGKLDVIINGKRCRSAGTVCMDFLMVSCSEMPALGDEAVIMGSQGSETITPDEIADKAGTISYEILTGFGKRIKRRCIY